MACTVVFYVHVRVCCSVLTMLAQTTSAREQEHHVGNKFSFRRRHLPWEEDAFFLPYFCSYGEKSVCVENAQISTAVFYLLSRSHDAIALIHPVKLFWHTKCMRLLVRGSNIWETKACPSRGWDWYRCVFTSDQYWAWIRYLPYR
jgi:hypothetical protein